MSTTIEVSAAPPVVPAQSPPEPRSTRLTQFSPRARLSPEWQHALLYGAVAWAATRLGLAVATYFGILLSQPNVGSTVSADRVVHAWSFWDAGWFLHIAQKGYDLPATAAFLPGFPLLIRAVHAILPFLSFEACGLLVSNLALLVALILLVRLTSDEFDFLTGRRAALFLLAYPGAFFLTAAYPHGLYLACVLAVFLALRSGHWIRAGAAGAIASVVLVTGILVVIPMAFEYLRRGTQKRGRSDDLRGGAMLLMPPAALGLFALYLSGRFGDPAAFLHAHALWGRQTTVLQGIPNGIRSILGMPLASYGGARGMLDAFPLFAALVVAIFAIRLLPLRYSIFALLILAVNLSEPVVPSMWPLQSGVRQVLDVFPVFMALAAWGRRSVALQPALLYLWLPLQGVLVFLILHGAWII